MAMVAMRVVKWLTESRSSCRVNGDYLHVQRVLADTLQQQFQKTKENKIQISQL